MISPAAAVLMGWHGLVVLVFEVKMSSWLWIAMYLAEMGILLWIARWGGASWLQGTFTSGFLVHWLAPRWSGDGLKLFAWLSMAAATFWFIVGIFEPRARYF